MNPISTIMEVLPGKFRKWANGLKIDVKRNKLGHVISNKSLYLEFNYTELLEVIYHVLHDHIKYIHGDRRNRHDPGVDYFMDRSLEKINEYMDSTSSLAKVDYLYFEEICKHIKNKAHWYIGYYSLDDLKRIVEFITRFSLDSSKVTLVRV